ncbi:unnamed protein product [Acanthoscelides obtectus]|uniref:MADF domain-containing protein n=1 Tax=Acanthoscelides obtectus TaxID=200917 RepID=A0A9P0KQN6_ACAOB|nr:unnamed protein product [Acanthoscelides obtectus]CAK1667587.1 hypothetical protein AOBTE_LOCUS25933 [Acanthoscelides obtectus]
MRKWKIILAQYRREKKKISDSKSSGSGFSDVYKPKWFAYAYLNFFHARDEPNTSMNSQDEINEQLIQEHTTVNESQESSHERPVEKFKAPKNSLKRRAVDEDPRISHALSIMDNVNKQMEARKRDDDDIFAAGVATKLRKIKDERKKILVQRDIDNLLYDAIIGTGKYATTRIPSPYSDSSNSQGQVPLSSFQARNGDFDDDLLRQHNSEILTWQDM